MSIPSYAVLDAIGPFLSTDTFQKFKESFSDRTFFRTSSFRHGDITVWIWTSYREVTIYTRHGVISMARNIPLIDFGGKVERSSFECDYNGHTVSNPDHKELCISGKPADIIALEMIYG